jgi:hypothetical protein
VASVLRSAAVKKVVPILSIRVEKVLQNVLRNSQFMKVIRDVHSFSQEESFNIRNNQPV